MKRKTIWAIIILMSFGLVGISIVQVFWIKWSFDLEKKNFDDKVFYILNDIKYNLNEDYMHQVGSMETIKQSLANKELGLKRKHFLNKYKNDARSTKFEQQLSELLIDPLPGSFLDKIDNKILDLYVKTKLVDQGITKDFDYAIYSKKNDNFVILNGNYVVEMKNEGMSSDMGTQKGLYSSKYRINLYDDNRKSPGYLILYFPNKSSILDSNAWIPLLASLILTILLIVGFIYNAYTILRQKRVSEMRTDFINNMTHEFKTPIATISLASDALGNEKVKNDPAKVSKFISIIKQENLRMLQQVEKVLQIALLDKSEFQLNLSMVDLHLLLKQTVEHNMLSIVKKNGSIETNFAAAQYIVEGDANHLSNVFHNILDNANKYTEKVPNFKIVTRNVPKGIEIVISDNGIGMSKETIKHIFEKFYRIPTGNVHNVKGFGLGLSYVKKIVDAHNGKVSVSSEKDIGSSFTLIFPYKINLS